MPLATALIHFALTDAVDQGVTGDAAQALNTIDGDSWIAWNSAFGVMMLGAGATVLTTALPRWMGGWHSPSVCFCSFRTPTSSRFRSP